jgi:hypothetical protein
LSELLSRDTLVINQNAKLVELTSQYRAVGKIVQQNVLKQDDIS